MSQHSGPATQAASASRPRVGCPPEGTSDLSDPIRPIADDESLVGLVRRARLGQISAFREIVETFGQATLARARAFFHGDEPLAQDAIQETWVRAFRSLPALEDDEKFAAWLSQILRHELERASRRRRLIRNREVDGVEMSDSVASTTSRPDAPLVAREAQEARDKVTRLFWRAVMHLPRQQQAVVELIVAGKSNSEIALLLGVPKGTVHTYRHRAQAALAKELATHATLWNLATSAIGQHHEYNEET